MFKTITNPSRSPNGVGDFTPLVVTVLDINDNPPTFDSGDDGYSARADKNAAPGTELVRVRASDRDQGKNARISYHLQVGRLA